MEKNRWEIKITLLNFTRERNANSWEWTGYHGIERDITGYHGRERDMTEYYGFLLEFKGENGMTGSRGEDVQGAL